MSIVDEFKNATSAFAYSQRNNAAILTNNILSAWDNVVPPSVDFTLPHVYGANVVGAAPSTPLLPAVGADRPAQPTLAAVTVPTFSAAPEFTLVAPVIAYPTAPDATLPGAPGSSPEFLAPAVPDSPVFTLPAVPVFENLNIPAAPSVSIPTFTSTLPIDDIVAPSEVFSYVESQYQSALLDALKLKLMQDLANGGYGIEPADEVALWDRAMSREMRTTEAALQDASRQAAARGFMLPPGALFAQLEAARQEGVEKASSLSRDIALKRADLYVENRKFTVEQVRETEQMLITYFGYMQERALNVAKAVVETAVTVYNARVAKAQYALERYKAGAQVYEVVLRAALANLEAYKIQVEGTKLAADVQRIHAEVYRTQLDGVNALANIYRTQMDGAKTHAEIEQLKLEAFKLTVETYAAQVGAKQAEFGMYESRLKGELAKVGVFQAEIGAYGTQVEAYKAKIQAAVAAIEAQIEPNKQKVEVYRADIARYSADVQKSQVELTSFVNLHEASVRGYSAQVQAAVSNAQVNVEAGKANADMAAAAARLQGDLAIQRGAQATAAANAFASVEASTAGVFGSMASAAISANGGLAATIQST